MAASTVRPKSAIEVWPTVDATVELVNVDEPTTPVQRFHVARKVTDLGGGVWHYEYAVHNMNSLRAADQLAIVFGGATTFTNAGFHDVNAHSNEPYDTTDWDNATAAGEISWTTPFFTPSQNANALRWATMYNFWFDANRPPQRDRRSTCCGSSSAGSPAELIQFWETEQEPPLFADGFESGDISASGRAKRASHPADTGRDPHPLHPSPRGRGKGGEPSSRGASPLGLPVSLG